MIDRVEALSEYVDRKARYFIKYRYAKKILSLRAFFHFIKQNLDSFVIRIEQVLRTIEALSPDSILILPAPTYNGLNGITVLDKPVLGLQMTKLMYQHRTLNFKNLFKVI